MILPDSLQPNNSSSPTASRHEASHEARLLPNGITGVACTQPIPTRGLVDWVAFTAPANTPFDDLIPGWSTLDPVELDHGIHGYKRQFRAGHIAIYDQGRPEMGIHVVISGQGCRELEASGLIAESRLGGWPGYFQLIIDSGWRLTRLDLAIDDYSGVLVLDELRESLKSLHVVSRWRTVKSFLTYRVSGGPLGDGLTFGSRQSLIYCRIYDKRLEQSQKTPDADLPAEWIRVELETKDEAANALAARLAAGDSAGGLVAGILKTYLQFKTPAGQDSNIRRWPLLPSWATFLGNVAAITLDIAPAVRTLDTVKSWLEKAIAPSLALIVKAAGGDLQFLSELVALGAPRLKPRHLALLPLLDP